MKVLVTDGLWRKSLSAVRSLGRAGYSVAVTGDSRFTTAFYSRYCSRRVRLPEPDDRERFRAALLDELSRHHYDVLLPTEDATIKAILEDRSSFERFTNLPLASNESMRIASDKAATMELAQRLGIAVPKTVQPRDEAELRTMIGDLRFPVVVKPRKGSGSRGIRYADSPEELFECYRTVAASSVRPLVQERIPVEGVGVGAALLYGADHEPVAGFTYKRLREYPITGGPSTLRESTSDPELLGLATKLLSALSWYGVAMVEFKIDPRDGTPKLLEINPRFWGSLELAIAAGVDFPRLVCQMATGEHVAPQFDYEVGVRCRWLVPGDILHFVANPKRFHLHPSFFQIAAPKLHYDDFAADDLRGSFSTVFCTAAQAMRPKMWKIAVRR